VLVAAVGSSKPVKRGPDPAHLPDPPDLPDGDLRDAVLDSRTPRSPRPPTASKPSPTPPITPAEWPGSLEPKKPTKASWSAARPAADSAHPAIRKACVNACSPNSADPEDVARKVAAAPGLKLPPEPSYDLQPDGRVTNYRMQNMGLSRKLRNRIGQVLFNLIVTHIPFHFVRQGFMRLFGATIGKNSCIMLGTSILDIEFLTIGDNTSIGNVVICRGLLPAFCDLDFFDRSQTIT